MYVCHESHTRTRTRAHIRTHAQDQSLCLPGPGSQQRLISTDNIHVHILAHYKHHTTNHKRRHSRYMSTRNSNQAQNKLTYDLYNNSLWRMRSSIVLVLSSLTTTIHHQIGVNPIRVRHRQRYTSHPTQAPDALTLTGTSDSG